MSNLKIHLAYLLVIAFLLMVVFWLIFHKDESSREKVMKALLFSYMNRPTGTPEIKIFTGEGISFKFDAATNKIIYPLSFMVEREKLKSAGISYEDISEVEDLLYDFNSKATGHLKPVNK
jgi:hypothetical protein